MPSMCAKHRNKPTRATKPTTTSKRKPGRPRKITVPQGEKETSVASSERVAAFVPELEAIEELAEQATNEQLKQPKESAEIGLDLESELQETVSNDPGPMGISSQQALEVGLQVINEAIVPLKESEQLAESAATHVEEQEQQCQDGQAAPKHKIGRSKKSEQANMPAAPTSKDEPAVEMRLRPRKHVKYGE